MIDSREFMRRARLEIGILEAWIDSGWLSPQPEASGWRFTDIDLARAQLIHDLRQEVGINDEAVGVILDLLDQIHGLRRTMTTLVDAICAEPEAARRSIAARIQEKLKTLPKDEIG